MVVAVAVGRVAAGQQFADLGQAHVQRPALSDEAQPLQRGRLVVAVVVVAPGGRGQQAGLLVVADGARFHAGGARQFSDAHGA